MSLQFLEDFSASHSATVWAVKWLPDDTVLSISADGTIVQWNASNGGFIKTLLPHPLGITSLSADAKGSHALFNSIEGTVFLWDLASGDVVGKKETFEDKAEGIEPAWSVSMHPSGRSYVSTGGSGIVTVHSTDPTSFGRSLDTLSPRSDGRNKFGMFVTHSPDGNRVALSTENGHIYIFDLEKKALVSSLSSHATCVRSLAWSADSQLLLSASDDKRLVLHDIRNSSANSSMSGSSSVVASFNGHSSWVLSASISPDGRLAASGSSDKTIKIWDIAARQCVSTLSDQGEVYGVSWRPTPGQGAGSLVSGSEDGKVRWWRSAGASATS